jgi:hypothetical protein
MELNGGRIKMSELTDREKEIIDMLRDAEAVELKKPLSERPQPMPPGKTEYPIGITLQDDKQTSAE